MDVNAVETNEITDPLPTGSLAEKTRAAAAAQGKATPVGVVVHPDPPPTVEDRIASLEARVSALENAKV